MIVTSLLRGSLIKLTYSEEKGREGAFCATANESQKISLSVVVNAV